MNKFMARLTQVSFWGPETLRGNGASARAKHQQATAEKVSAVTTERINMLKTLKRKIALGAVAAVGAAGLVTIAAPVANAVAPNAASLTVTAIARAGVDVNLTVAGLTSAGVAATGDEINAVVLSTSPAGAAVPVFNQDATYTAGVTILSANSATETLTAAAGTVYQILVWADPASTAGNTSAPLTDSITKIITVTVGGTPSVAALKLPTTLQLSATGNGTTTATPNVAVSATVKDANGVATILKTNESLVAKITGATTVETVVAYGSVTTAQTAAAGTASATMTVAATDMGTYTAGVGDTATATATIAVSGGGLLTGALTGATGTIQVGAAVDATAVSVTGTSALSGTLTAGKYTALAADPTAVTVPTTTTALTFTATVADANFGKYVDFVVTSTTAGLVTAGHNLVATDATTGKASFTVTALTAPAATNSYTVVVKSTVTSTVTYQASTFGSTKGVVTQSPTATTLTVKAGATLPLKVTVTDQFGTALQNAVVNFSNAGTRNTANVNILTDATGVATYSYTDKGTTASTSADTIAIGATYGGNTIAGSNYTVNYVATDPTATTVTFSGAVAATQSVAVTTSTVTAPKLGIERAMTLTAGALTSTGATLPGVPVTWVASGNGVFGSTSSTYTDTSGNASGTVYWTKTGTQTVTVTIGGKSATLTVAVVNSKALATGDNLAGSGLLSGAYTGDERIISLTPATTALTSGNFGPITATVKDRYGNTVSGVTVTFSKVGSGRFGNGAASVTGVTLADGTATIDYGSGTTESGDSTITATFATGDGNQTTPTALLADGVTAAPAAVVSATAKVSIKASSAAAGDTASAAAQKATDTKIADIATAVTNLSTTVAGLVASLVAQIKDTKAAITDTQNALAALAAVVKKIQVKVKA